MNGLCTIIGAGPGLGSALARRFAAGHFQVALVGRQEERLARLARSIASASIAAFPGDASSPESLKEALNRIHAWGGDTDILIYNAAAMTSRRASTMSIEELASDTATNVGGAVTAVTAVLPAMKKKAEGRIVFTGGGLALTPHPEWVSLSIGKAALRAYSIALHQEVAPHGIHAAVIEICGIIEPGGELDPDALAERYWTLCNEPKGAWSREIFAHA